MQEQDLGQKHRLYWWDIRKVTVKLTSGGYLWVLWIGSRGMTRKTLELSDYDDIVRMLELCLKKCNDVDLDKTNDYDLFVTTLEYELAKILARLRN